LLFCPNFRQNNIDVGYRCWSSNRYIPTAPKHNKPKGFNGFSGRNRFIYYFLTTVTALIQELLRLGYPEHNLQNLVSRYRNVVHDVLLVSQLSSEEQYLVSSLIAPRRVQNQDENMSLITQIRQNVELFQNGVMLPHEDPQIGYPPRRGTNYSVRYIPKTQQEECTYK
jgi:hypothetical protein